MLAKKNRLTSKEFKEVRVFSFYRGPLFDIKTVTTLEDKYAVVVSAKTCRKAVERNKLKRTYYCIIKEIRDNGTTELNNKSFIFYPKRESLTSKYRDLKKIIYSALEKKHV